MLQVMTTERGRIREHIRNRHDDRYLRPRLGRFHHLSRRRMADRENKTE
jgi:hypothetical protein